MDEKITSRKTQRSNTPAAFLPARAFRRSEGRFLAEGRKLCPELARGAQLETLFIRRALWQSARSLPGCPVNTTLWKTMWPISWPMWAPIRGCSACFRTPVHTLDEVKAGGRYLALERVQDPGNVGTLLRSAAAFGFDGVILSDGCASVYAPKTLRASMGAAVRIPVIEAGAMPDAHHPAAGKGHHLPCCRAVQVSAAERGAGKLPPAASASSSAARVRA